ncbi:MAG: universal stress protein [Bacteroidales bacterium]|jgi:nucleotide-binding universal stress UspA family protein|nr:universal stress protein [Bacteroidales bacterium]
MKIILSTDFSAENEMLFPYAIDLLKEAGGEIILFHAFMDQILMGDSSFPGGLDSDTFFNRELLIEMEEQAGRFMQEKQQLLEQKISEAKLHHIMVTPVLKGGDPEMELIQLAEKEQPDLVLMGTHGKGKKSFLEGSMAKSVMTKLNVPLLSIPQGYKWNKSDDILYATNFGRFEVSTINRIFDTLRHYHPVIHVVHLQEDAEDDKPGLLMEELKQAFRPEIAKQSIRFHLLKTTMPKEALVLFCEQNNISMASFIANRRKLIDYIFKDKIGKDAFFDLGIPMLTVREP